MKKIFIVLFGLVFLVTGCTEEKAEEKVIQEEQKQEEVYEPKLLGSAKLSVEETGDYTLTFNVNNEGTVYYMIQPYYEVVNYDVTPEDVEAGKGQEFVMLNPDGEPEENPMYVVSAKSVVVTDHNEAVIAKGYMGDIKGTRPPAEAEVQFSSVVWYVFKDVDGNYSDVLNLTQH